MRTIREPKGASGARDPCGALGYTRKVRLPGEGREESADGVREGTFRIDPSTKNNGVY